MKLYRTFPRAGTFIYGMRDIILADICFISRIIYYNRSVLYGVVNPHPEPVLCDHGACRIVRIAEIYDVGNFFGKIGAKSVFCRAVHIDHVAVSSGLAVIVTGTSGHHVTVNIHRIYGIADGYPVVRREYLLYVSGVGLCSVGYEYLVLGYITASCPEVVVTHGFSQKSVPEIGGISPESLLISHLIDGRVKRADDPGRKRSCDITDPETDDLLVGIGFGILRHLFCYRREQIAALEFLIIPVNFNHFVTSADLFSTE